MSVNSIGPVCFGEIVTPDLTPSTKIGNSPTGLPITIGPIYLSGVGTRAVCCQKGLTFL